MNIFGKLKEKGWDTIPEGFYSMIDTWKSWYTGNVKGFHDFRVFNGQIFVKCRRYTLNMGKKVAEDWANLLMNEKVKITLEGQREQDFFDQVCRENNFAVKANEMQEIKAALGTAAYVVRVTGATVREADGAVTGGGKIKLDYVSAEHIFPLAWENGRITECAFSSRLTKNGKNYLYLQAHQKNENGTYIIENILYENQNENLKEVPLTSVKAMETVPAKVDTGSDLPLFVIDRMNLVNNYDNTIPMGIPVFANAIDQIKGADIAYDSYINEFVLGKKRIIVKPQATKDVDGEPIFDVNDLTYYVLPEDSSNGGNIIEQIDMSLRTQEHNAGLQDMLNALSSRCGFGENHYKFDNGSVATATQVVSENATLFRTIKKHEIILEAALTDLCRIILRMGNRMQGLGLDEDVKISIDFDDSIIEDKNTEFLRDMQMLSAGILNAWEFRMKWRNEDEATAKAALPGMEAMTDEGQDEIE